MARFLSCIHVADQKGFNFGKIARLVRPMSSFSGRTDYAECVKALNSLQSNHATLTKIREGNMQQAYEDSAPEMVDWLRRLGYEPEDLDRINPIHVAGTKGKGSTSAFISSILSQYSSQIPELRNVGLYTSPHLRFVRERIKINNTPLTEDEFTHHFVSTWNQLSKSAVVSNHPEPHSSATKPAYFRYLTLMAFETFMASGIKSSVIETGVGGQYDYTNILVHPTVTAITSLGVDHEAILGGTIEKIAWHKAGIMKNGSRCFSAPQPHGALQVLQDRAKEKDVELSIVNLHPELNILPLGLAGEFQKINASIAIEVAAEHLRKLGFSRFSTDTLPPEFRRGLQEVQFGGRCETRREGNITFHLDGAHTLESIEAAATWFASCVPVDQQNQAETRVLIFNQQVRNASKLLVHLREVLTKQLKSAHLFDQVSFCTNQTFKDTGYAPDQMSVNTNSKDVADMTVQKALKETWQECEIGQEQTAVIHVSPTIEEAVSDVRDMSRKPSQQIIRVLVIGSIHLIGGVLEVLESRK